MASAATVVSMTGMAAQSKTASLRQMIQQAVTEDATLDGVRQLIADVFASTKARKITCPECGVEFRANLPDVKAEVELMISLLEQSEGKASTEQVEAAHVTIVRPPRG